jgi:lysyl-tRNA synthetase class 2
MAMPDRNILQRRAALLQATRKFFIDRGFLEVDTPVRLPALAPEAHIEPETADGWYLQTSPELCMKRLLAAGCPALFQICKCFRRHERGDRHLPEFTMLEWYRSACDYQDLMDECEEFVAFLSKELSGKGLCGLGAGELHLLPSWDRLTVAEAFCRYSPVPLNEVMLAGKFDEVLCLHVEPQLGRRRPVFLYDYPASLCSLARLKAADKTIAERFELYINGLEIANGFSELTDAEEQRARFLTEMNIIRESGRVPGPMPDRFLDDLVHLRSAAGIALGMDRLAMVLWGVASIDGVVPFTPENL